MTAMSSNSPDTRPESVSERPILSRTYAERQIIVVADDLIQETERWVMQVGATAEEGRVIDPSMRDRKANTVIYQMIAQVAVTGGFPAIVNWAFTSTLMGIGVMRIGNVYGVSMNRKAAWKLIVQFFKAAGFWYFSLYVSSKILAAVFQGTGIGYIAGASLDVVISSAIAFAIGMTAKAYFQGEQRNSELGNIMRTAFKAGKQKFTEAELKRMRDENRIALFDYEQLHDLFASEAGRGVVHRVLLANPEIAEHLAEYISRKGLKQLQDLSVDDLKTLDDEFGLAHEIWEMLSYDIDLTAPLQTLESKLTGIKDFIELWARGARILIIDHQLAGKSLRFPTGHPRSGILYIGHPAISNYYYPAAHFHRLAFEHKFFEAVRILRHLGATQFTVEHVQGRSTDWSSTMDIGLLGAKIAGKAGGTHRSEAQILYTAKLPGTTNPVLPVELVWYPEEPSWQEIADGRLKSGLQNFDLYVRYTDDFGINTTFTGKLGGAKGIDLGGKFEDYKSTTWRIVGSFGAST